MNELCNIDGCIVARERATVPVMDRGFLFGDSVYEVMRTHAGVPFAWPEHLARLRASADGLGFPPGPDDDVLVDRIAATLAEARPGPGEEAYIRVIVTRGDGTAPSIDLAYAPGPPRCVILVRPLPAPPAAAVRLALVERRRVDRRALDPALKTGNYLNNVLALAEARRAGADDCVMLNTEGAVTEASTANVFIVQRGRIATPPLHAGILAGVTRALLLALCARLEVPAEERSLSADDLRSADEIFLSSTLRDVLPVTALDGRPVGRGDVGPLTARLAQAFAEWVETQTRAIYEPRWRAAIERARRGT